MTGENEDLELIRRGAALSRGVPDSAIRRARESGALTAVARGVYLPTDLALALTAPQAERLRLAAVLPSLAGDPVVSHVSAAVLHGLPFSHSDAPVLHVTRTGAAKTRRGSGVHGHRGALPDAEVVTVGGLRVTTVARTVVDCARVLAFPHAVAVADAALHRSLTSTEEVTGVLRRHPRLPGIRAARAVLAAADRRAASAWESHSRVALADSGLSVPVPGLAVVDGDGRSLGRAPFGWPAERVAGAPLPDDRAGPRPDPTSDPGPGLPPDGALAAAGWLVVRWGWPDLATPGRLVRRLGWALGTPVVEPTGQSVSGQSVSGQRM